MRGRRGIIGDDGKRVEIRADVTGGLHPPHADRRGLLGWLLCALPRCTYFQTSRCSYREIFSVIMRARHPFDLIDESRKRGELLIKMIGPGITGNNSPSVSVIARISAVIRGRITVSSIGSF